MSRQQLRASQLVRTFGPGSMVDLPKDSVIVGGLEGWRYRKEDIVASTISDEPRLVAKVQELLQVEGLTLRRPPAHSDAPGRKFVPEVEVWRFPRWFTVKGVETVGRYRRRRLVHSDELIEGKFQDANGKKHQVVPVRFVRACPRGHVDDLNWKDYVHRAKTECIRPLHLEERGTSGDLGDIFVVCECGKQEPLYEAAFRKLHMLGTCTGRRPWLGPLSREDCDENARLLVRNASNAYFPQVLTAISIPPRGQVLDEFVAAHLDALKDVAEAPAVLKTLRKVQPFVDGLREYDDATVQASIQRVLQRAGGQAVGIKEAEFEALADVKEELGSDTAHGHFYARALPKDDWQQPWMQGIRRVVLVHRLREVVALVGFTRFESAAQNLNGELDIDVQRAAIARDLSVQKWVPAVENRGEGVFLEFDPKVIHAWAAKKDVVERARVLENGFHAWVDEHQGTKATFPDIPYVLLHSIAHLLLTSLSLECGYPASSLRERIYALPNEDGKSGRYGILIYTGSSDAEGTLGGLVEAGRSIARHLQSGLELAMLCSNDPVCASHDPAAHGHSPLLGAACHGCLLISETSCEMRNDFLDRALVVPTVEAKGCEFLQGFA